MRHLARLIPALVIAASGLLNGGCAREPSVAHLTSVSQLPLKATVIFDRSDTYLFRVFQVREEGGRGELRLLTSHGVWWLAADGTERRSLPFTPVGDPLFVTVTLSDDNRTHYAGFDFRANAIRFFDGDGIEVTRQPCWGCWDVLAADADGTGRDRLVARDGKGGLVRVFDASGTARGTIPAVGYLSHLAAGSWRGNSGSVLFLYSSPDPELKKAVRVRRVDGAALEAWPIAARRSIGTSRGADGSEVIVSFDGNTLVEWDPPSGAVVSRATVEGAEVFAEFHVVRWRDGSRIVVLSGGGTLAKHMLAVVTVDGTLVFREVGAGRAHALTVSAADARVFHLAVEGQVRRYALD